MPDHGYFANLIWQIADLLRDPYRPPQYERVMLPMTVLRCFDCVLAPTKAKVLAEANILYMIVSRFRSVDLHPATVPNEQMGLISDHANGSSSRRSTSTWWTSRRTRRLQSRSTSKLGSRSRRRANGATS